MCVNNLAKVAPESAAAGIWTRDLLIESSTQALGQRAAQPHTAVC